MVMILTKDQEVAFKALQVNYKNAEDNMDETIWLLPTHAERLIEIINTAIGEE